jgi:hypothetical protein
MHFNLWMWLASNISRLLLEEKETQQWPQGIMLS